MDEQQKLVADIEITVRLGPEAPGQRYQVVTYLLPADSTGTLSLVGTCLQRAVYNALVLCLEERAKNP